jgi:hypothetical protein
MESAMNNLARIAVATLLAAAPLAAGAEALAGGRVYYKDGYSHPAGKTHYPWRPGPSAGVGFAAGAALGLGAGLLIARPPPPPPVYYAAPPVYYPAPSPVVYYPTPPPPRVYYGRGWTEAHIEWCINRYRSYNPATNTFTGYDGLQHECVGPY